MRLLISLLPQLLSQVFARKEPRYHLVLRVLGYLLVSIGAIMAGYMLYNHFAFTFEDQQKAGLVCLALLCVGLGLIFYKRKPAADPVNDLLMKVKGITQTLDTGKIVNEYGSFLIIGAVVIGFILAQRTGAKNSPK